MTSQRRTEHSKLPPVPPAEHHLLRAHTALEWSAEAGAYRIVIPQQANIARDTVGRHSSGPNAEHVALAFEQADGTVRRWTFREVHETARRLAASLARLGVGAGDRIAIHTGPRPETGIAHMAVHQIGAIAVTLSQLYGTEAVRHVLEHSGSRVLITQDTAWSRFRSMAGELPALEHIVIVGEGEAGEHDFETLAAADARGFHCADTRADDPALLMYTSGSTGMPKGLLHGHRLLHAYSPTISLFYNLELDNPNLVFWTPADWAWVGGLFDLLLPAWEHGQTVVTSEHRFDAEWAYDYMARQGVTHAFMPPTALKRLAEIEQPRQHRDLRLRVICTGGEPLPAETMRWIENELGVICNEFYGLTEVNHLIGNCQRLYPARAGSMGRAYPGHATTLVDEHGERVADGEVGQIVARADDPTRFLGYWKHPELTREMELNGWLRTGDLAVRDADGYFWYRGRVDDLIKTSGHRVGPAEVENALLVHAAVAEAAVIGSPDAARGHIVKAFVRLQRGHEPSQALIDELQAMVRRDLGRHKYPREIEFVEDFPLTSSGKIDRKTLARAERASKAGRIAGEEGAGDDDGSPSGSGA